MKIVRKSWIFSLGLTTIVALFGGKAVFADELATNGIQISPSVQRAGTLEPGSTYTNRIAVTNSGGYDIVFQMVIDPYSVEDITYAPIYSVRNAYTQITNWIEFEEYESHLAPGEMSEVVYHINVPKDVPGGGQYAVIAAEIDNFTNQDESVTAKGKVGMILTARINGETRLTGDIVETKIPMFLLAPPVSATATFQNSGNVDADATMILKIEDYFTGSLIYDGSTDPLEKTILPETTRELTVSWANVPRLGILKVTLNTEFMGDAEVKSRIVIVCPIWFLALIILIILVIIARIVARKREEARTRANSRNAAGGSQKFNI